MDQQLDNSSPELPELDISVDWLGKNSNNITKDQDPTKLDLHSSKMVSDPFKYQTVLHCDLVGGSGKQLQVSV